MNMKAPTSGTHGQGKVHTIAEDGLTICRQLPRDTWEKTDADTTCKTCLRTAGGWRKMRPKRRA